MIVAGRLCCYGCDWSTVDGGLQDQGGGRTSTRTTKPMVKAQHRPEIRQFGMQYFLVHNGLS